MLVAQHFAKTETVDVSLNKANCNKTGIPFNETASALPITLSDDVSGIKATVDFDLEVGQFVFDINGEPFENHPFLDSSFTLEDTETKIISAKISINEKIVSEGGKEWQPAYMQHSIWNEIQDKEPIK